MSIIFKKSEDTNNLNIEISNVNLSLINAMRRVILSEYPTIGFNIDDYLNSDIKVITNTSSINNEFIMHRIGLVPIHYSSIKAFDSSKYKFVIDKQNTSNSTISVKSNDFKVYNTETGNEEESIKFFPPDPITNDFILILRLKQNPNKVGEKLHIEGKASIGTGSINARYSPVSCITFNNKIDESKKATALQKHLDKTMQNEDASIDKETLNFNLTYGERYFHTDENDEPNIFEMFIESIGVIPSYIILYETLDIIKQKLNNLTNIINKIISEENKQEKIQISKSLDTMDAYEVKINDETHTIGNIIQSYASLIFNEEELPYIGYRNPHPLKKFIVVKLKTSNNTLEEVNNIFSKINENVTSVIDELRKQIEIEFKIKKTMKMKKPSK